MSVLSFLSNVSFSISSIANEIGYMGDFTFSISCIIEILTLSRDCIFRALILLDRSVM